MSYILYTWYHGITQNEDNKFLFRPVSESQLHELRLLRDLKDWVRFLSQPKYVCMNLYFLCICLINLISFMAKQCSFYEKKCQVYSDFTVTLWALRITLCGFNIFVIPKLFKSKNYIELVSKLNTWGPMWDCITTLFCPCPKAVT